MERSSSTPFITPYQTLPGNAASTANASTSTPTSTPALAPSRAKDLKSDAPAGHRQGSVSLWDRLLGKDKQALALAIRQQIVEALRPQVSGLTGSDDALLTQAANGIKSGLGPQPTRAQINSAVTAFIQAARGEGEGEGEDGGDDTLSRAQLEGAVKRAHAEYTMAGLTRSGLY